MPTESRVAPIHLALLATAALVLVWSAVRPHDYFTWILEVFPALIGGAVLIATFHRFRFTTLVYVLITIHAMILMLGGHYTYAEVPLGNWIRDAFGLARNDFDRIGHFAQGFVPALIAREVLIRRGVVRRGAWLSFIVVSICLAISAAYELVEWLTAISTGTAADAFLGTQGDPWDTQEDMATAFVAAIIAAVGFGRLHDHALDEMQNSKFKIFKMQKEE
jgi:putative membrane protein